MTRNSEPSFEHDAVIYQWSAPVHDATNNASFTCLLRGLHGLMHVKLNKQLRSNLYTWQVISSSPIKLALGQYLAKPYYGWYFSLQQSFCSNANVPFTSLPATSKYTILMFQRKNKSCNCQYCDGIVESKLNRLHKLWTKYRSYWFCESLHAGQFLFFKGEQMKNKAINTLLERQITLTSCTFYFLAKSVTDETAKDTKI